jgi:lipopolysaccharide export system permease protein
LTKDRQNQEMLPRFDRYLARLIAIPLFATLTIAAMLLLLEKMLKLFDFVVNEGGPVSVVWRMLGNLIPQYLGLGIPVGLLLGVLLAFRRLALSSELDALRSVGISYTRLLRVPYLYALAMGLLTLIIVGFIQPISRYAYEGLEFELRSGALGATIDVGEFVEVAKNTTLRVEESFNQGRDLRGVFVHGRTDDGKTVSVTATRGTFLSTDDPDIILLRLTDGTLVHDAPEYREPRVLTFRMHDLPIDLPKIDVFRVRGAADEDTELTLPELLRVGYLDQGNASEDVRRGVRANLHRRLIQVFAVLFIPLLAVALAVPPKRSGSAVGVFLALAILIVYNEISEAAERAGAAGEVNIVLSQWGSFIAFGALCLWFFHVLAHVPGGQPIAMVERGASRAVKFFASLWRLARRRTRHLRPAE